MPACGGTQLCSWLALQLLGSSLEHGFNLAGPGPDAPLGAGGAPAHVWGTGGEQLIARVGKRVLKALSWVHHCGLVHRDVKVGAALRGGPAGAVLSAPQQPLHAGAASTPDAPAARHSLPMRKRRHHSSPRHAACNPSPPTCACLRATAGATPSACLWWTMALLCPQTPVSGPSLCCRALQHWEGYSVTGAAHHVAATPLAAAKLQHGALAALAAPSEAHADKPHFHGTPLFASVGALREEWPSARDDVEGLLYSLLAMAAPPLADGTRAPHHLPFRVRLRCWIGVLGLTNGRQRCVFVLAACGGVNAAHLPSPAPGLRQVVLHKEANGGWWPSSLLQTWAARKEAGWRAAVREVRRLLGRGAASSRTRVCVRTLSSLRTACRPQKPTPLPHSVQGTIPESLVRCFQVRFPVGGRGLLASATVHRGAACTPD